MRYEFIHDTIAKQVFYKAGAEARTRRKVEKYIREHYEAFKERGAELTDDDIDYIKPYLELVNVGAEEAAFVRQGEARLRRKRRRRQLLTAGIIAFLSLATLVSIGLWRVSVAATTEAERQEGIAIAKSDSLLLKEAELQVSLENTLAARDAARAAQDTAEFRRLEAESANLLAQLEATRARRAEAAAERRAREARSLALAATARSIEDELPITALQLARVAYGVIPESPLPTVSQTLSSLFYEQFPDGDGGDPGAPLYEALMPFDPTQFAADRPDRRQRFTPVWSPDGQYYLLPATGQRAALYRRDGTPVAELPHAADRIDAAAWSPDGRRVATGDQGGRIQLWDLAGKALAETRIPDWVSHLQFSPDGRYLYAWSTTFSILESHRGGAIFLSAPQRPALSIWDTRENDLSDVAVDLTHYLRSDELRFSPDGQRLLLPTGVYDLAGRLQYELDPSGKSIQVAPEAGIALTRNAERGIRLWDLSARRQPAQWGGADDPVREAHLATETGEVFVLYNNTIAVLYGTDGREITKLPPDDYVDIVVSPDARYLVTRAGDQQTIWDRDGKPLSQLTETAALDIEPRFSPNGRLLLFRADATHPAIWRPRGGVRVLDDLHEADIRELQFDPSGEWILSRDAGNRAYLWSSGGRPVSRLDKHQGYIEAAAFSPDGTRLLTADRVGRALLWQVNQVKLVQQYGGQSPFIERVVPLPNADNWLVRAREEQYALWAPEGGEYPLVKGRNAKYAVDPTGRHVAIQIGNRPVTLWDRATGKPATTIDPQLAKLNDIRFSPDGRYLIAVSDEDQLHFWSVAGDQTKAWPTDPSATGSVRMAATGNYAATQTEPVEFAPQSNIRLRLPVLTEFAPTGGYLVADSRYPPALFRVINRREAFPDLRAVSLAGSSAVPTQGGSPAGVCVWGTDGRPREVITYRGNVFPSSVSFTPDGALFAVELHQAGTVVYDSLGRLLSLNRALAGPKNVVFSPDNRHLVATYGRSFARVFTRAGRQVAELNQLNETVVAASFSPDGKYILLQGAEKTAQLYDLRGQLTATFDRQGNRLVEAHFSEGGQFVLTLDRTGTLRGYPVPSRIYAWLQREGRLPPLTAAEKARYGLKELDLGTD